MVEHIQDKRTGKMAGSIGDGKNGAPKEMPVPPVVPAHLAGTSPRLSLMERAREALRRQPAEEPSSPEKDRYWEEMRICQETDAQFVAHTIAGVDASTTGKFDLPRQMRGAQNMSVLLNGLEAAGYRVSAISMSNMGQGPTDDGGYGEESAWAKLDGEQKSKYVRAYEEFTVKHLREFPGVPVTNLLLNQGLRLEGFTVLRPGAGAVKVGFWHYSK